MGAETDFYYSKLMQYVADQQGLSDQYAVMDNISRSMGGGSEYGRYADVFYGINRLSNLAPLPLHREDQGLVLFTRPNLNLSYDNIATVRNLAALFVQDPTSYQYAVRMMLDTTTYGGTPTGGDKRPAKSPLVDPQMPYLNLFTNLIQTMSSPPDIQLNAYRSPEGMAKEVWLMNDSISQYNGYFDLTCTFNNIKGNVMGLALHSWINYIGYLRTGPIIPHPESRRQDKMDYFTRIERYKFDITGRKIEQWFHTGASFPTNLSLGAGMAYNREEGYEFENKSYSVQFACVGACYNDPIQLYEFNLRISRANPNMADDKRKQVYTKVDRQYIAATNYHGYPWINLQTMEFEWWVANDDYAKLIKGL